MSSGLNVVGGVTIQSGTTFNANGLTVALGGDWTDNGTFTAGGNSVTFNGSGAQALTKPGGEFFASLIVNKAGGSLLLNSSASVDNTFALSLGTIDVGASTLTLNSTVAGGGILTSGAAGTVAYGQVSPGQGVLPGTYGNLALSNFDKVFSSSGTIGIAGTFTPGSATGHTTTGSTIDFNGTSQSIPAFPYFNLTLSGTGTKSAIGAVDVAGSLTNGAGVVFTGVTSLSLHGAAHTNGGTLNAGSVDVGSGAALTNNGAMTAGTLLGGLGTLAQGSSGTLSIAGSISISTLNASAIGNTVIYTGAGQSVQPVIYHHLTLAGSGTPILAGVSDVHGNLSLSGSVTPSAATGMTIGGNCTIGLGTTLNAVSFALVVKGNWVNTGTFNAGTGSVTLGGTVAQTVVGSTFHDLTVNNTAGVAMAGDNGISNSLTLANGVFSIGAHVLTLNGTMTVASGTLVGGSSSDLVVGGAGPTMTLPGLTLNNFTLNRASGDSLSGDVTVLGTLAATNGTLNTGTHTVVLGAAGTLAEVSGKPLIGTISTTRTIAATSGTISFGNIGAEVTLHGVALGATTIVRRTGSSSAGSGHASIGRSFDIAPATNTGLNAGFVFHYDPLELAGQNAAMLELYRSKDNGATWTNLGGTADTASRTISLSGISDFSRWTAADTADRIGSTPVPTTASIAPASKNIGESGFTLVVDGTNFVEGKSAVRFNGVTKPTSYVSEVQLTASVPASDLLSVASMPVTVFNSGGGGLSNAQTFAVLPLPPKSVRVESASDGSGSPVPVQALASGSSITVYAIARDSLNNFVFNAASTWALQNLSGGVVTGDLVPSPDGKSAIFTAHATGSAAIAATSGLLTAIPSGIITVTHGIAAVVRVETASNGSGTIVPSQSVASGNNVTVYAIVRDASNNFVANDSSTWSLLDASGGIALGDLVPATDGRSALFTGHLIGAAKIFASSGVLPSTPTGILTVTPGAAALVVVETAGNGSGTAVGPQSLASGSSMTVFAVTRDASGNFVANVAADLWSLQNTTGGVIATDLVPSLDGKKAVFTGHGFGSAKIRATSGTLASTSTGTLTVVLGSVSLHIPISAGWNLVSNPVLDPIPGDSVLQLYPASVNAYAFSFNAAYVQTFTLVNGKGYWAKFGGSATETINGSSLYVDTIAVTAGWNLIGSISAPLPVAAITSIPAGIVTNNFFGYAAGYSVADTLLPGQGYWVKVAQSGSLVCSAYPAASPANAIRIVPTSEAPPPPPEAALAGPAPIPSTHVLEPNYPNPFNPSTTIRFGLPTRSRVRLEIYSTVGQRVAVLLDEDLEAGFHEASWNASDVASGLYIYRIQAVDPAAPTNSFVEVRKMLLVR